MASVNRKVKMKSAIVKKTFITSALCILLVYAAGIALNSPLNAQDKQTDKIQAGSGGKEGSAAGAEQFLSPVKDCCAPVAGEKAKVKGSNIIFLYEWFRRGGIFMWPILLCAALGMGLIIERFIFYKKAKLNPREFIEEFDSVLKSRTIRDAENLCAEKKMVISRILLKGLKLRSLGLDHVEKGISAAGSIEIASLEKGLSVLSAVGNIAPLIGFLGTVSGMITAFQSIAAADQVSARLVAGGIYEALITTEAGLIVAIPVLAFYNYFIHRIEAFVADIERISADIAEKFLGEDGKN
jgi:biopolymer transport protein ExbB